MSEELNNCNKHMGGTGITANENVTFGDINGQFIIGNNNTQTQTLSASDKKELLDNLIQIQKEIAKLSLPENDLITVNGDLNAAINPHTTTATVNGS